MVVLWLETTNKAKGKAKVSMKLMASLAKAEVDAGVVAKADQLHVLMYFLITRKLALKYIMIYYE